MSRDPGVTLAYVKGPWRNPGPTLGALTPHFSTISRSLSKVHFDGDITLRGSGGGFKRDHTLKKNTGAEATLNDLDDTAIQTDRQRETDLLLLHLYVVFFLNLGKA